MHNLAIFGEISTNLQTLEINEIKDKLQPLFTGLKMTTPIIDPSTFLYRARKVTPSFNKAGGIRKQDLVYPPKECATLNRLNRHGAPMMYCSAGKEAPFFEIQNLQSGDEVILTIWQTTAPLLVSNIGYTDEIFSELGSKRPRPLWVETDPKNPGGSAMIAMPEVPEQDLLGVFDKVANGELLRALSKLFMSRVEQNETFKYKMTVAIGELHMGDIANDSQHKKFAGVVYPSIRMSANGDNVALLPEFVDRDLAFRKAIHVRVESRKDSIFQISNLDEAMSFGSDGKLIWLGRLQNWTLGPGQSAKFICTAGSDSCGDYSTDKNGKPRHWVARDMTTGQVIPAR